VSTPNPSINTEAGEKAVRAGDFYVERLFSMSCTLAKSENRCTYVVPMNHNQEAPHDIRRIYQHLFLQICSF